MSLDKAGLLALVASEIPDNTAEEITPSNVRTVNSQQITSAANLNELNTQNFLGPITFNGVSATPLKNRIVINEFSDFPDPLLPNTQYKIGDNIVFPDTLPATWNSLPQNIEFSGSLVSSRFTWGGTGTLFTGVDMGRFRIINLTIDAPLATIYNITDISPNTVINLMTASVVDCLALGTINVFALICTTTNILNADQGLVIGDKAVILNMSEVGCASTSASFVYMDITAATIPTFEISNNRIVGPAGSIAFKGLAGSANIAPDQRGAMTSCEFVGDITALDGIDENDFRYVFMNNSKIKDSNPKAMITLTGNTTATTISASSSDGSNAVLVAGTWALKAASQYTWTTAGKVSALFETLIATPMTASLSVEPASGTNQVIAVYFAVDGVVKFESGITVRADNNDPKPITIIWQEDVSSSTNTDVELYVENRSSSTDILVSNGVLRIS